ncbi:MAG: molybdopterin dinucleotide binding domain-containing protein, partial [Saprospiraceae bacterium]|nr:molybdopterin dinucleotide binding domain-containing protein [Saprospiraceae bacterium]
TTAMSDLVLPTDTFLESWGDDMPEPEVGFSIASVSQPVVSRLYDTRSAGDIILALAHQIGSEVAVALPWTDSESYLKDSWKKIYRERIAVSDQHGFDNFWNYALTSGVWGEDRPKPEKDMAQLGQNMLNAINIKPPAFAGSDSEYPYMLFPVQTQAFLDGRGANLPWVQELPDPMTSIVYNSWVELNPLTAKQLGIREGDVLEVQSVTGKLQAPAFIYHGIRPDVIAIPVGQGHTQYGRYAKDRGVNPLQILAPEMDTESGALAWAATRVRISKTGKRIKLIKTDGVTRTLGRQILTDKPGHANKVNKHG